MSVLGGIFGEQSYLDNPAQWLVDGLGLGRRTRSGENVTPEKALTMSTYFAILRVLAEDMGKTPFNVIRDTGERTREIATDHPVQRLLTEEPSPDLIPQTFFELGTQFAAGWGGGYFEIERRGATPIAFHFIHSGFVTPKRDDDYRIVYDVFDPEDRRRVIRFDADDILHIRGFGDSLNGYSLARYGAESIGLSLAAQAFGAMFFGNGARTDVVLTHPKRLDAPAHERLRESWKKTYGGNNAFTPAILEEGMTVEKLSIPPEEAQFLETRKFQAEEMCRWGRVNPNKIQIWDKANYNTFEHAEIMHVNDTLMPWAKRWQQEIKRKCIPEPGVYVKADFRNHLRGDHSARSAYYRELFNIGGLSQNDIRWLEDMNPIGPEGDTYYVALNMGPSEQTSKGSTDPKPAVPASSGFGATQDDADEEQARRAMGPVIEAEIARMLRKEQSAVNRLMSRYEKDRDGFVAALSKFYIEHRGDVVEALTPCASAVVELLGGGIEATPWMRALAWYVDEHVSESTAGALMAYGDRANWAFGCDRPASAAVALVSEIALRARTVRAKDDRNAA